MSKPKILSFDTLVKWHGLSEQFLSVPQVVVEPALPIGVYKIEVPADVPVGAFWSVTVYNDDGYMQANELGVNSYNNFTARPNANGAYTIHFGGCEDGRLICIPVTKGWNHTIRFYEPRAEILDGSRTFPAFEPVDRDCRVS